VDLADVLSLTVAGPQLEAGRLRRGGGVGSGAAHSPTREKMGCKNDNFKLKKCD